MPKQRKLQVTTGQRFGRLEVIDPDVRIPSAQKSRPGGWRAALCRCDCGNRKAIRLNHLLAGSVLSCGCLHADNHSVHGLHSHPLYSTWANMMHRCHNPKSKDYARYGASGVSVCPDWHDVRNFTTWIDANLGSRPDGMTLDRYPDPAGNYEPGNVRWATDYEQVHNTRAFRSTRLGGTTLAERVSAARTLRDSGLTQKEIAAVMGVAQATVSNYLNGGTSD